MTTFIEQSENRIWNAGWRDVAWADLDRPWDLIIIGGGITGAGILREAVRCGLQTLLLEARDFASGTSSRSSKLVHGGFRYLRNAQIKLTYQAVHERERLLNEARGLVTPLGCLLASYAGDSIPSWVFWAGLIFYDILALRWGHRRYDRDDMQALCPSLCEQDLRGGFRFFDAQTDDARLVLRVIQEAVQEGGLALNYMAVTGLLREKAQFGNMPFGKRMQGSPPMPSPGSMGTSGRVCGVVVCDQAPGGMQRTKEVFAPVIVNATGAWADDLRQMITSDPGEGFPTGSIGAGAPRLRRLRGSHLLFPSQRLPLTRAVNVLHPQDGRPVFAYTWEGVTLVGTTDVDHQLAPMSDPQISPGEIEYLMKFVQSAFPAQDLDRDDIQATFSGIRAVVNTGKTDPSKESREHVLWNEAGLLTITGGKLTTFRLMALEVLKAVFKILPEKAHQLAGKTNPAHQRILDPVLIDENAGGDLPAKQRLKLAGRYGGLVNSMVQTARPEELKLITGTQAYWAELRWAAKYEAAEHLDDLLLRRVRLGLLLPKGGLEFLQQIRAIVQPEMGWDDETWETEQKRYSLLWQTCYQA